MAANLVENVTSLVGKIDCITRQYHFHKNRVRCFKTECTGRGSIDRVYGAAVNLRMSSSSIDTTTFSWVSVCSTTVEHSQQDGFYRVPLLAARQTPNLEENQGFRAFQLSPQEAPSNASESSSGRWNNGRETAENFAESGDLHVTFGFFYMP
jgi:hypothetical protein